MLVLENDDPDWLLVKHKHTNDVGLAPSNYVQETTTTTTTPSASAIATPPITAPAPATTEHVTQSPLHDIDDNHPPVSTPTPPSLSVDTSRQVTQMKK